MLYTSPHPEIQPNPLLAPRCYIRLWRVIISTSFRSLFPAIILAEPTHLFPFWQYYNYWFYWYIPIPMHNAISIPISESSFKLMIDFPREELQDWNLCLLIWLDLVLLQFKVYSQVWTKLQVNIKFSELRTKRLKSLSFDLIRLGEVTV